MEQHIEVPTPAGRMDTFIARPDGRVHQPAVLILMDIWGVRAELEDIARRLASQGYCAILPNTYYRQGRVRFEFRDERGRMRSIDTLAQDVQDRLREQMFRLTDAMVVDDATAVLAWLDAQGFPRGPVGCIGYCMGGRHALAIAGHLPERVRASACLHGTRLVTDSPSSVHRLADRFRGEIYCGFAERDPYAAPPILAALAQAIAGRDTVRYTPVVHAGIDHGYALPDRDIYDRDAAETDWSHILAMYRRQLAPRAI